MVMVMLVLGVAGGGDGCCVSLVSVVGCDGSGC